jgi:hypothetical protein
MPTYPNVNTLAGMIRTGLTAIASWLSSTWAFIADQESYLSVRYPDAPPDVIAEAAAYAASANDAAKQLEQGLGIPPLADVPVNPSIPTSNTIGVDVIVKIPDQDVYGGRKGNRVTVYIPDDLTPEEQLTAVYDQLRDLYSHNPPSPPAPAEQPEPIDLDSVTWQIQITSVTRS